MEKTFEDSMIEFIQKECADRGWVDSKGNIDENDVFTVLETLGSCTTILAKELKKKDNG